MQKKDVLDELKKMHAVARVGYDRTSQALRKSKARPSEAAMTLADVQRHIDALSIAIEAVTYRTDEKDSLYGNG